MSDDCELILGDALDVLPTLVPRSVQCIVTSPPYFGLRDYGVTPTDWPTIAYCVVPMPGLPVMTIPAQSVCLGLETTPEAYVGHLVHVFRLARKVLADDGVVFLNLGDSYANDTKWGGQSGGKHALGVHGNSGIGRGRRTTGLPAKNLMGIPWRVAFALQADGWILRNDVIWHKPAAMPESVKDRFTKDHEYVFFFSKNERYYFDQKAVRERATPHGIAQQKRGRSLTHKNINGAPGQVAQTLNAARPSDPDRIIPEYRNRRTVWRIGIRGSKELHYAPMPEALVEPCILAGSRVGDTVLDMFGGTGTVARVALRHNRRATSIDINPDYVEIQQRRTNAVQRVLLEAMV